VQKTDALLKKYSTSYKKYFRFPGLCFDPGDVETIEAQGYTVIGDDVYAGDGFEKSPTRIVSNILTHVRPGSIVILHMHGAQMRRKRQMRFPMSLGNFTCEDTRL
jgi:hypothetical protein